MSYFVVTREHGPGWNHALPMREQKMWDAHARFMDGLVADGSIVLGGPVGDGERVLLIMRATGPAEIDRRLAADPWAPAGLLRVTSIEAWQVLLGGD